MTPHLRLSLILFALVVLMGVGIQALGTPVFDPWISRALSVERDRGWFWLALSHLGKGQVVGGLGLVSAGLLWLRGRGRTAGILVLMVAAELMTNPLLKMLYARTRPDLYDHLDPVFDLSYPSGHSAQNACIYLLLALLVDRRLAWIGAPLFLLIGASRVVLGVHWPTDVLGGWMEGAGFALLGSHLAAANGKWRRRRSP